MPENPSPYPVRIPASRWDSRWQRALARLREKGIEGVLSDLRRQGFRNIFSYVITHLRFQICILLGKRWDKAHGVITCGQIDFDQVRVVGSNVTEGHAIVSTSPATFRFLTRYFPQDRDRFTFIDVGSGFGRTLMLARNHLFRNIVGIEFATEVCELARTNIGRFRNPGSSSPTGNDTPCDVLNLDATQYDFPGNDLLLYMSNPFSQKLWRLFMQNLESSLREKPRKVILITTSSIQVDFDRALEVINSHPAFVRKAQGKAPYYWDTYRPYFFAVYETGDGNLPSSS